MSPWRKRPGRCRADRLDTFPNDRLAAHAAGARQRPAAGDDREPGRLRESAPVGRRAPFLPTEIFYAIEGRFDQHEAATYGLILLGALPSPILLPPALLAGPPLLRDGDGEAVERASHVPAPEARISPSPACFLAFAGVAASPLRLHPVRELRQALGHRSHLHAQELPGPDGPRHPGAPGHHAPLRSWLLSLGGPGVPDRLPHLATSLHRANGPRVLPPCSPTPSPAL